MRRTDAGASTVMEGVGSSKIVSGTVRLKTLENGRLVGCVGANTVDVGAEKGWWRWLASKVLVPRKQRSNLLSALGGTRETGSETGRQRRGRGKARGSRALSVSRGGEDSDEGDFVEEHHR